MKKVLAIFMALVLCTSLLSVTAFAAGSAAIGISDAEAQQGEKISVDVAITSNPGVMGLQVEPAYDDAYLTLDSISATDIGGTVKTVGAAVVWDAAEDFTYTGKIMTLNFTVKADAPTGTTTTVSVAVNASNYDEELVDFDVAVGTVTVKAAPCTHANTEIKDAKEATCTEKGYTGDTWCKDCGTKIKTGEEIALKPHTPAAEKVGVKSATCSTDGYTGDVVCSVCKEVIEKGQVVKATGKHTYKDGVCSVCGKKQSLTDGSDSVVTVDSTKAYINAAEATFADVLNSNLPDDVKAAIGWASVNGITTGISDTEFGPFLSCTRAQVVTFLWRAEGCPAPKTAKMPFTDVAEGAYYYDAVLWAVENGITKGTSDTTFSPDATVTRAQVVTFLWRCEGAPKATGKNPFTDVASEAYYYDAVIWAVKEGITKGISETQFGSDNACLRYQIVTFLYRYIVG